MLEMNNLENSLTMLHLFFTFTCNQISWGGGTIFNTYLLLSFHSFHHHHPFFIPFTIHEHFFSDKSSIALCFIHIDIYIGMIHKDKENTFLCMMMLSMHINSLSFSVSVWLNYYAASKQMMK